MKRILMGCLIAAAVSSLTSCETARYTKDQVLSKSEFGNFQHKKYEPPADNMLANADQWIRRNLW